MFVCHTWFKNAIQPPMSELKFLQNIFRGPGLLLNLKLENPLRKTVLFSGGDAAVKRGGPGVLGEASCRLLGRVSTGWVAFL